MNEAKIRSIEIKTGVSADFLENTLTQDISTLEALYDLIDNSIDAARNKILSGKYKADKYGLPKSYEGFEIKLIIDHDSVKAIDNCCGIDEDTLKNKALFTARRSSHQFGIGHFGLGLKRSLLKIGSDYEFEIDNSQELFRAEFSNESIGSGLKQLKADVYESSGDIRVCFTVKQLKAEIKNDLQNKLWLDNAVKGFLSRYAVYLEKGLKIILESIPENKSYELDNSLPSIRKDSEFVQTSKKLKYDDVEVIIESGIHDKYTFPSETNYSLATNKKLTNDFGIYYICNDRIVVSASTSNEHGWKTKWHSEYNGYVCLVRIISADPSKLPWNTSKTAMRSDSSLFLSVRDELQPIADNYRREIKKRYEGGKKNKNSHEVKDKPKPKPKPKPHEDLNRDRDIFIDWDNRKTNVPPEYKKAYNIYAEMCRLSSKDTPIACVFMLRAFLEITVSEASSLLTIKYSSLAGNSKKVAGELANDFIDKGTKTLIERYADTSGGLFSVSAIQSQVHSKNFHPSKSLVNQYWDELDQFLSGCWNYIESSKK